MNIVSINMETMAFIKSDAEFNQAKTKGFWQTLFDRIRGQRVHLLPFSEAIEDFNADLTVDRGLQDIPLTAIVGSVGRSEDYTRNFLPRSGDYSSRERWRKVYTLVTIGSGVPAIELYKVDDRYFVIDGHHRVSVAKHLGWQTIQAHVTELPLPVADTRDNLVDFYERGGLMKHYVKQSSSGFGEQPAALVPMLRLVLYKNEVCRIPQSYSEVRVVSGNAWVTMNGRDMFLVRGERANLGSSEDVVLISALGKTPLVLEVRSEKERSDLVGLVPQQACC
ncbi:MAG: ParB N-terminal domain-containing protein [Anaerolineae bacterium]|nr:ParB N-terminal domain-containing protein [Anaerolineae bacterium]